MAAHDLFVVMPTDHRAWLWIAIIICLIFSCLGLCFRLIARFRRYGLDDLAIIVCFIFVVAHASVLGAALKLGFGIVVTPATKADIEKAAKLVFAARPLFAVALWASKCSALLLLRRLIPRKTWRTWVCDAALVLITVWCFAAILTTSVACTPSDATTSDKDAGCAGLAARISTTTALNIATELGIFGLVVVFFRSFDMELKFKYQILALYSLRVSIIALKISWLVSHLQFLSSGTNSIGLIPTMILSVCLGTVALLCPILGSVFTFPLPSPAPSDIELQRRPKLRRLSTPMSFWTDRLRGDREVFKHKASVFATAGKRSSESGRSTEGIIREETFEIETKRFSAAAREILGG